MNRSTNTAATTFPITPSTTIVNRVRSWTLSWVSMLMSIEALGPQNARARIREVVGASPNRSVPATMTPAIENAIATTVWAPAAAQTFPSPRTWRTRPPSNRMNAIATELRIGAIVAREVRGSTGRGITPDPRRTPTAIKMKKSGNRNRSKTWAATKPRRTRAPPVRRKTQGSAIARPAEDTKPHGKRFLCEYLAGD